MRRRVVGALALVLSVAPSTSAAAASPQPEPSRVTTVRDARITESSGLALSAAREDVVWTINDSGSAAWVYGVSLRTGETVGVLRLRDSDGRPADVVDTESLAPVVGGDGRRSLLVADIGDNRSTRDHVTIWRVAEPTDVRDATVRAARLDVRYAGGPADAEALVATTDGRLLVITKALLRADVYEVPPAAVRRLLAGDDSARPVTAQRVTRIPQTLVTGADALPDGRIVVRGYGSATIYRWSAGDLEVDGRLNLPAQRQGESIVVESGGRSALVSSEGTRQPLWRVPVSVESVAAQRSSSPSPTSTTARTSARPDPVADAPVALWALAIAGAGGLAASAAAAAAGVRSARRRGRRTP